MEMNWEVGRNRSIHLLIILLSVEEVGIRAVSFSLCTGRIEGAANPRPPSRPLGNALGHLQRKAAEKWNERTACTTESSSSVGH